MKKKLTLHVHLTEWYLIPDVMKKKDEKVDFKKVSFLCFTIVNLKVDKDHEALVQKN